MKTIVGPRVGKIFFYLGLFLIFCSGIILRIQFSPDINFETDSFVVLLSAKNISETGRYTVPPISLIDYNKKFQSNTGWAVGYPLLLSFLFSIFGYGENVARWATIFLCSAVIPVVGLAAERLAGARLGIMAGLLVAVNPLLICINGRILTANLGFCFLTFTISFLILGTVRQQGDAQFVTFKELTSSRKRLFFFSLSFLFFGLTLASRDDHAMFGLVFFIVLWEIIKKSYQQEGSNQLIDIIKLVAIAGGLFFVGLSPNLYFNYQTYGKMLTSAHHEFGGRLSLSYFLQGANGALGLPGWAVILLTLFIFAFPFVSVFFVRKKTKTGALIGSMIIVMLLPILLINGSYPVASSGASPRYIIPLVPLISIVAAVLIVQNDIVSKLFKYTFVIFLIIWHVTFLYPPAMLFKYIPKTTYLTQYSPWYNRHNFINYPHPIRSTLQWVKTNTPANAIILSDYDWYHYYFYTKRDVMSRSMIGNIENQLIHRPVFFIEDHQSAVRRESLDVWRKKLSGHSINLKEYDSIPLYSPKKGEIQLKIYELTRNV